MNLRDILGVDLPVIQAPMAGVQDSALAVAVCKAGGLGSLPAAMLDPGSLRRQLRAIRSETDRPCNVNFFCHAPPVPSVEREAAWRDCLRPYFEELGVPLGDLPDGPAREPFNDEVADVLEEFRPGVVSFHFGLPAPALLDRVRSMGATILCTATTVEEARWLEQQGVDVIIAQGLEAGGHRGMFLTEDVTTQAGTLALVPQVLDAVRVPVVAAGGIADASGVAAAMALGAAGVQAGTAFLLCPEATTGALHRAALAGPGSGRTVLTNLFTGRPARGIVNRLTTEIPAMRRDMPGFPLAANALAPLRAAAEARGSTDFSPLWCGQNARGCRNVPAGERLRQLAAGLA